MAEYGGTSIFTPNVSPETRSAVSSRHKIFAPAATSGSDKLQIGVVGTFDPSHGRGVDPVRGIGYGDTIAELVPSVSDPVTISVSRTLLYLSNIFQVFGYLGGSSGIVRDLKHHRWPFDIKSELVLSALTDVHPASVPTAKSANYNVYAPGSMKKDDGSYISQSLITIYEACWITSYSTSYPSDASIITETVDISVTDVLGTDGKRVADGQDTGNGIFADGDGGGTHATGRFGAKAITAAT